MGLRTPAPGQTIADSLKLMIVFGAISWWPSTGLDLPWPLSWAAREYDLAAVFLFLLWAMAPWFATMAFMFLPRDLKLRFGWLQVSLGLIVYGSLWWHLSQFRI